MAVNNQSRRAVYFIVLGALPPHDTNVLWLDTSNIVLPVLKIFWSGAWTPLVGEGLSKLINDLETSLNTTWSSEKLNEILKSKQSVLVAGDNIIIDGNVVSAIDTKYTSSDFDIKDLSDSTGLREFWNEKQDKITAGTGIIFNDNVISLPTEENKLLYSYDNKTFTPEYLIPENYYKMYVVNNDMDFNRCKNQTFEPEVIKEWQQYSDCMYMPEFGIGKSYYQYMHKPQEVQVDTQGECNGIGYGYWNNNNVNDNKLIYNPVNSYDFNGWVNQKKSPYFHCDVLIGTDKGNTTGDWAGFALVNDDYAVPRHIICSDGNNYYRNTLYDLTDDTGEMDNPIVSGNDNLWCAWVHEDKTRDEAYVIYGKQSGSSNNYVDDFPSGTVNVYKIIGISTKQERKNHGEDPFVTVNVSETKAASGFIAMLNILTINSTGCNWNKNTDGRTGTISIFTTIIPCEASTFIPDTHFEDAHLHAFEPCVLVGLDGVGSKTTQGTSLVQYREDLNTSKFFYEIPSKTFQLPGFPVNYVQKETPPSPIEGEYWLDLNSPITLKKYINSAWTVETNVVDNQCAFRIETDTTKTDNRLYGWRDRSAGGNNAWNNWTSFSSQIIIVQNDDGHFYICEENRFKEYQNDKCHNFNQFLRSNVLYNNGVLSLRFSDVNGRMNANNVFDESFIATENLTTNFPYNGSKVVIDFNNGVYTLTDHTGTTGNPIQLSTLPNCINTYTIDGKDITIDIRDLFKDQSKFMYIAFSQQNLLYKCVYFTYTENLILRADNHTVWKYDYLTDDYEQLLGERPQDYFTGSHLSLNDVTNKLWYSSGRDIYQIGYTIDNNSFEVTKNGNAYLNGIGEYDGTNIDDAQTLQEYISSLEARIAALEGNQN